MGQLYQIILAASRFMFVYHYHSPAEYLTLLESDAFMVVINSECDHKSSGDCSPETLRTIIKEPSV